MSYFVEFFRLHDVLHSDRKLTLVFEYCDQDLKKYFDTCNGEIDPDTVKVRKVRCLSLVFLKPILNQKQVNIVCV